MKCSVFVSALDLEKPTSKRFIESHGLEWTLTNVWGFDKSVKIDGDSFYESLKCNHRSRYGEIHEGVRYSGIERQDKAWLNSMLVSDDCKLLAKGDKSLLDEIASLGRVELATKW